MSKPRHDYSDSITAYKSDPTIADKLPDTLRTLLQLHFIEAMRWCDVADAMNYSLENIYRLREQALNRLEAAINGKSKTD